MTRAVNNRTRERNYFKLYCEMLDGNITEEEFDKEIEEHEDKYIIKQDKDASIEDIEVALEVSPSLMSITSPDDMAEVFSFSENQCKKSPIMAIYIKEGEIIEGKKLMSLPEGLSGRDSKRNLSRAKDDIIRTRPK